VQQIKSFDIFQTAKVMEAIQAMLAIAVFVALNALVHGRP